MEDLNLKQVWLEERENMAISTCLAGTRSDFCLCQWPAARGASPCFCSSGKLLFPGHDDLIENRNLTHFLLPHSESWRSSQSSLPISSLEAPTWESMSACKMKSSTTDTFLSYFSPGLEILPAICQQVFGFHVSNSEEKFHFIEFIFFSFSSLR